MKEELFYFAWKFNLYKILSIHNNQNSDLHILNPGYQNLNAGPDFSEAKLKSDNTIWVGNVEIHCKSSDWYKHGHHLDQAYNSVILQVVLNHDKEVLTENGRLLPVIEIEINSGVEAKYQDFLGNKMFIPCEKDIYKVDQFKVYMWLSNVLTERLSMKTQMIEKSLSENKNNWEETFYQIIARSFGFKINSEPFEWLAKSISLNILAKHHSGLQQIEALLFGQAGFLEVQVDDCEYYNDLKREYQFLKSKYNLKAIESFLWKFLRIRPSNFPTIRIAQFANLVYKSNSLFSKILKAETIEQLRTFFQVEASTFWDNHYHFHTPSVFKRKILGNQSQDSILINTVVPILFIYGKLTGNDELRERSLNFLDMLKPEKNEVLTKWKKIGLEIPSAFYSQALLGQKKFYCSASRCLECGIGAEILKMSQ